MLTAFFATSTVYGEIDGILYGGSWLQLGIQLYGIVVVVGWSAVISWIILICIDKSVGLRVSKEQEKEGLDVSMHGESACGTLPPPSPMSPGTPTETSAEAV